MRKKIILLAILFLLMAIPAAWLQLMDGVMLDGRFFVRKNDGLYANGADSVSIRRDDAGAEVSIMLNGQPLAAQLTVEGNKYSFTYEDGRNVVGYAGQWTEELVDADGAPIWLEDSVTVVIGNEQEPDALSREYSLSNALYHMAEGNCEKRGHALEIVMAMLIYALGVASFFWPEEVHFFGCRWRYANAELSYEGLIVQKISGVACGLVGIVLLYAPLFW